MNRSKATRRSIEVQSLLDGAGLPPNTRRVYAAQWRQFAAWCAARGSLALPARPRLVVLYLVSLARQQLAPPTLTAAVYAIAKAHAVSGLPAPTRDPIVRRWRRRLRHELETEPPQHVTPLTAAQMRKLVRHLDEGDDLVDLRDRALLLVGWMGKLRRSELVALDVEHILSVHLGAELHVRGQRLLLPAGREQEPCPVRALEAWIRAAGLRDGPLFRSINRWGRIGGRLSDRAVTRIVQARVREAGIKGAGISADSLYVGRPAGRKGQKN
jgi:integrase